jgi:hypothetical protein
MSFAIAFIWSESVGVASAAQYSTKKLDDGNTLAYTGNEWSIFKGSDLSSNGEIINSGNFGKDQSPANFIESYNYDLHRSKVSKDLNKPSTTPGPTGAGRKEQIIKSPEGNVLGKRTLDPDGKENWLSVKGEPLEGKELEEAKKAYEAQNAAQPVGVVSALWDGVQWGAGIAFIVYFIATAAGLENKEALAITAAAFIATTSVKTAWGWTAGSDAARWAVGVVGVLLAVAAYALLYEKQKEGTVVFICSKWNAPAGGKNCEQCNNDPMRPCSEYRCRSLGAGCELLNAGTGKEACVYVTNGDVVSPTIVPWEDALKPRDLKYSNVNIRPPSLGMKIVKGNNASGGCLTAFTPLVFGLATNEAAQCKIDYRHTGNFSEMEYYFGESELYLYNHTHTMLLPNAKSNSTDSNGKLLGPVLKNDGTYTLFVRCQDRNGNSNADEFAVNFCVDPSPDVTQPVILNTSIPSGGFVRFGVGSVPIDTYVNEWADCRWSITSKAYAEMENRMSCPAMPIERNAELNWVCSSNFTGIVDRQDNKYYIRCRDQPNQNDSSRNENTQSYELNLRGSQPLNIISAGPNETSYGSTATIKTTLRVVTDDGAQEGRAQCYFSDTGGNSTYILMENTNTDKPEHTQELQLVTGRYKYYFRCVDAGGNSAEKSTAFGVVVDQEAPAVTRIYRDNGLKVVTNEDAECVYSLNNCNYNFAEGLAMQNSNPSIKTEHYTESKANAVYYIKCRDGYGNEPAPNSCNIIVNGA